MRLNKRHLALCICVASFVAVFSRTARAQTTSIDIPVVELPYNFAHGVRAPGMQQSLAITTDFYEYTHAALGRIAPRHRTLTNAGITAFDFLTMAVPFADAWVHEEWHRAVLGKNNVDSRNDVWNLKNIFASSISVSHVTDEDLIRFKKDSPRDFVRMKAAGIEGEAELISRLEKNQFFNRSKGWHAGLYWLIALNDALYVGLVTSPTDSAELDNVTIDANVKEKTIAERDVSGHDFTAWVYHLFRPTEPFENRGIHPSGVGIDRYIKVADLTAEEKQYLRDEGRLMIFNFVDPNLIGISEFKFRSPFNGDSARANFWMRHTLTSFGHATQAHFVYKQADMGIHVTAERYANHDRAFPGIQAELVDAPLRAGTRSFSLSPRVGGWLQPRGQTFMTRESQAGGLIGARLETRSASRLELYVDGEAKTAGWVAGRPSLDAGGTFRVGLSYSLSQSGTR